MEQPTARRHRHATGAESVSVADLLAKSTPDERASMSRIQERAAVETRTPPAGTPVVDGSNWETMPQPVADQPPPSTELVRYEDAADEQDSTNRLARTITGALVAMALCGAVTAVAVLGGGPPQRRSPSVPALQPAVTAGPAVVRPLAMIDQLVNGRRGDIPPGDGGQGAAGVLGPAADRARAEKVVKDFYGALPLRKEDAFAQLGPALQDDGFTSFDRSWRGTRQAEVQMLRPREEDGGLLRVKVSAEQFDGSVLQLIQLVDVRAVPAPNSEPQWRIVDVRLLSAYQE